MPNDTYPINSNVILSDSLLTGLGVPLDGTATQRTFAMILAESSVGSFLRVALRDTSYLGLPPLVDVFEVVYPPDKLMTLWGPVTSVVSIEISRDGTTYQTLPSTNYQLISDTIVFLQPLQGKYLRVTYHGGLNSQQSQNNSLVMALVILYQQLMNDLFVMRGKPKSREPYLSYNDPSHSVSVKAVATGYFGYTPAMKTAEMLLLQTGFKRNPPLESSALRWV